MNSNNPYAELRSGFGMGVGFGPLMLIWDDWDFILPLKIDFRYTIMPQNNTAAYFRFGPSYHLVNGTNLSNGGGGFFIGTGVEFLRNKNLGVGFEVSYDSVEVGYMTGRRIYNENEYEYHYNFYEEKIKPCEFMFSLYIIY